MLCQPHQVREHRGEGLEGQVDGTTVSAGSRPLVLADKPLPYWAQDGEERHRDAAVLRVFLALNGELVGIFTLQTRSGLMFPTRSLRCGPVA